MSDTDAIQTDDDERRLRLELMAMDLELKRKQSFWETPRNIAVLLATAAATAGVLGYKLGQSPQPIVIYLPAPPASPAPG